MVTGCDAACVDRQEKRMMCFVLIAHSVYNDFVLLANFSNLAIFSEFLLFFYYENMKI